MASEHIYVKLIKKWGHYKVGDVVRFGRGKGLARISAEEGVQVKKQKAVNDPIVETATSIPHSCTGIGETEEAVQAIKAKADAKANAKAAADVKAQAEADAKAKADADAKAKANLAPKPASGGSSNKSKKGGKK